VAHYNIGQEFWKIRNRFYIACKFEYLNAFEPHFSRGSAHPEAAGRHRRGQALSSDLPMREVF
jgi:hypothetical protein